MRAFHQPIIDKRKKKQTNIVKKNHQTVKIKHPKLMTEKNEEKKHLKNINLKQDRQQNDVIGPFETRRLFKLSNE